MGATGSLWGGQRWGSCPGKGSSGMESPEENPSPAAHLVPSPGLLGGPREEIGGEPGAPPGNREKTVFSKNNQWGRKEVGKQEEESRLC